MDEIQPLNTDLVPPDVVRDNAMTPVPEPMALADNAPPAMAPATPGDVPVVHDMQEIPQPTAPAMEPEKPAEVAKPFTMPPPPTAEELDAHAAQLAQDFSTGAIRPKTYKDLMPEGTLGKIGAFFGLMLSGAGAGLTGQPNAVLAMMDKTISNDLEAQKASAGNKLDSQKATAENKKNIYSLALQHQQNETQEARLELEKKLADAQMKKIPSEIAFAKAQIKNLSMDNQIKATTLAKNTFTIAALHSLDSSVALLPPGPQKDAATIALNDKIKPAALAGIQGRNAETAKQLQLRDALAGGAEPDENLYQKRQQVLRLAGMDELAKANDERHMPGVNGQSSVPLTEKDREHISGSAGLIEALGRLKTFVKKHPKTVPGSAEDAEGKLLAAQLAGDYRMASDGGVYKESEQYFINQIIPEDPTTWSPTANVMPKIEALIKETTARKNHSLKSKGFAVPKEPKEKDDESGESAQEIERIDPKTKKTAIFDAKTKKFLRYK